MQQMTLCGRCSDALRDSYIVRLMRRGINEKIDCDVCKRHTYGGTYDVEKKRRKDDER